MMATFSFPLRTGRSVHEITAEFANVLEQRALETEHVGPEARDRELFGKADGHRAQVHLYQGKVTVYSRRGLNWTKEFARIAEAAHKLGAREAVFDGEAVVYGTNGVPDFQALRRELGARNSGALRYHAFDLLYLDGSDLRPLPYVERKRLLEGLLKDALQELIYVEYLEADGPTRLRARLQNGPGGPRREAT
jgi:bifunctional non-homologous end joining protein LigD